jgi:hypothetical protein
MLDVLPDILSFVDSNRGCGARHVGVLSQPMRLAAVNRGSDFAITSMINFGVDEYFGLESHDPPRPDDSCRTRQYGNTSHGVFDLGHTCWLTHVVAYGVMKLCH